MNPVSEASIPAFPAGLALGAAVAIAALLVWLAGLILVLRGAEPRDRPALLRAYAVCRPPLADIKRACKSQLSRRSEFDLLNRHQDPPCPARCNRHCDRAMIKVTRRT